MHQIVFFGWSFAPDPTGGAYSAPQDPVTVFRGLLLKEGEGEFVLWPRKKNKSVRLCIGTVQLVNADC